MWCSFAVNLLVVTLQKKLSAGSDKVSLTDYQTVGCWHCIHVTTLGHSSLLLPPGAENPSYCYTTTVVTMIDIDIAIAIISNIV